MAKSLLHYDHLVEEDYIDMDISSSPSTFSCCTTTSPPHSREFEFHMSSHPQQRDATTSPADELFYKGKLLPLHLPPRLEMVHTLLQSSNINSEEAATNTTETTPFESCNISPVNSCYVSGELKPEDYYYECSSRLIQPPPHMKKSWTRRLKSIKQSPLGLKLKASRAYFRSLFSKPRCSDEAAGSPTTAKECSTSYLKTGKTNPFGQIHKGEAKSNPIARYIDEEELKEEECCYRRSFSGIIKWHLTTKTPSVSSSSPCTSLCSSFSSRLHGPQMLKRSSSINSDIESSIQGAIAYCKKSQQTILARKSVSDVEFCSISSSRIAAIC